MDLTGLADFLETQEIGFTSILKNTRNIDPEELKRTLTKHHAQMVMIAGGRYPIKLTPSASNSPDKPRSDRKKRPFTSTTSDEEDYEPSAKASSGKYKLSSSSTSTPTKFKTPAKRNKTPTPSSSSTRSFNSSGRMKPAGASTLFKNKSLNYSKSPSGFKIHDVIDLVSGPDSEFEEAEEGTDIDDIDVKNKKQLPIRKGVATRKVTSSKKKASPSTSSSATAKKILANITNESDEGSFSSTKKRGESSGGQKGRKIERKKLKSKAEIERETAAIPGIKEKIAILEKSVTEVQDTLTKTNNFLARKPLLDKIRYLKALITSNKLLIEEASGLGKGEVVSAKSMAATVEDAPEDESDTLFVSDTPTKGSSAKRRCGGL
ncbi:hypothetical protein ACEPPN_018584 [Leptodophora sp. 'Broadleaf-Isolate-01']